MRVSLDKAREIFGYPRAPVRITQRQFDGFDEVLQRLGRTPLEEIDLADLWYYHHDLAYVPLQRDLFVYLFPLCLWDWHITLMANQSCSHGDSEFHYGIIMGEVLDSMLSPDQRSAVFAYLRNSMLDRLDQERGFVDANEMTPAHGWLGRWNSLGLIMPEMEILWDELGQLSSPGQAVAAIEFISLLMYFADENPLFGKWTPEKGGGPPTLSGTDSLVSNVGWLAPNVDFAQRRLTPESIGSLLNQSVRRLSSEPEFQKAQQIQQDFSDRVELVQHRLTELPAILKSPGCQREWSV